MRKIFSFFFYFLLALISASSQSLAVQSTLPPCPAEYKISGFSIFQGPDERWNNCFGKATDPKMQTYIGEWKNGLPDGQGQLQLDTQTFLLGIFQKQKITGPFIKYNLEGDILESGTANNGKITSKDIINHEFFDTRLTVPLVKKGWSKYFSQLKLRDHDGMEKCLRAGFMQNKLIENEGENPKIYRSSDLVKVVEKTCENFIAENLEKIKKISNESSICNINGFSSFCIYQAYAVNSDGQKILWPAEKIYEALFSERSIAIGYIETSLGKASREAAEETQRLEKLAEQKRRLSVNDSVSSDEGALSFSSPSKSEIKDNTDELKIQEKISNSYQGKSLFACSGSFAGESLVENYSLMLIKLLVQGKKNDFAEMLVVSNQRLATFEGDCRLYRKDAYTTHTARPAGKRILVDKKENEEYVLYRTQGSFGVGFLAEVEKPVEQKSKPSSEVSKSEDNLILPKLTQLLSNNGIVAYKPDINFCKKASIIDPRFHEEIARYYKISVRSTKLIRVDTSSGSCIALVDTPYGPIRCSVMSVLEKKNTKQFMLSWLYEMDSGNIAPNLSCNPHPEVFERR